MAPLVALVGHHTAKAQGMRHPAIGVGHRYIDAVRQAGGQPVLLPPMVGAGDLRPLLARFDALVLVGGGDVDPARYGEEAVPEVAGVDASHDDYEAAALRAAVALGRPVLAICRGLQILNVAWGGSLVQHLPPSSVVHRAEQHDVELAPGCRTAEAMGTTSPRCSSFHHQAVARLGAGLQVVGRADDGVVEAVEGIDPHGPWLVGVQWHPEDTADVDPAQQGLFDQMVREAASVSAPR